jgi:predicted nucleic acid-binding Zn ribbon protein
VSDLQRIGELLPARVAARRRSDPVAEAARAAWPALVGDRVAGHSAPIRVSGDALVVHCSSSTWASELTLLGEHVHERLRGKLGDAVPARLRFEVGELPARAPEPASASRSPVDPARAARASALASGVADDRLRQALELAIGRAGADLS